MTEKILGIGLVRLGYLDTATKLLGSGDIDGTLQYINNFLLTIKDGHPASKEIQLAFDKILMKKNNTLEKLINETEKFGKWEQAEARANGKNYATIQEINDRLNDCWQIALRHGLFSE